MEARFDGFPEEARPIVYVRPVNVAELPAEVQAHIGAVQTVYALHRPDGERLALVRDRETAFVIARQNDLAPVSAH
jgi:hypothetical protein